jgi:AAA domain-containing protein
MSAQTIDFVDPVPESAYARVAITGPSGSGKTWTSLLIARGLAGPDGTIGLVDTEHHRATKYRRYHDFKVCDLSYYDPRSLITAVARATERGIDVLDIDSLSHFWSGAGGVLAQVDKTAAASYSGNKMGGWKDVRPLEAEMMEALLGFPGHLIVTMRVKTEWVLETQQNGRTKPVKVGLKPDQREGIDYEWDLVGGLDTDHVLTVSKTNMHEIEMGETIANPDIEFGARIAAALREGATPPKATAATVSQWRAAVLADGVTRPELEQYGRAAAEAGASGVIVTNLAGGTISFGDLVRERWRATAPDQAVIRPVTTLAAPQPGDASEQAAAPAPAAAAQPEPQPAAAQPQPPAAQPAPAAAAQPGKAAGADWLQEAMRRAKAEVGSTPLTGEECRALWAEAAGKARERKITPADAASLQALLAGRLKYLRDEATAALEAQLGPDDPWVVKVTGLTSPADAGDALNEVMQLLADERISEERATAITTAITTLFPVTAPAAPGQEAS